ncbi:MAG TPA: fumarylacetoacetate hydrolase family protein [Bacteroidia bacterium]|jgi:2-keto-4-pentenoate hydratase/2-oxohepta-3-ene-1,7-dioic acid hydratase in catechol pathway|nr:fumarylacetoacetate hydrolase family protein [Bacteroidia bacterium]
MKFICIGRNYAEHAKEMNSPVPTEPVLFLKPETAYLKSGEPFYYPEFTKDLHHEIEIVLKFEKMGKHIDKQFADRYYTEIGLGIDFTARDLQMKCKEKGLPWEKAKAFDFSAPLGKFLPVHSFPDLYNIDFRLDINGKTVQRGNTKDLIFKFDALVAYASQFFTIKKGDYLFTGTPEGVGPVKIGDRLEGYIGEQKLLDFEVK